MLHYENYTFYTLNVKKYTLLNTCSILINVTKDPLGLSTIQPFITPG